jgi:transcriptional regulator with XRE-family HTH domain
VAKPIGPTIPRWQLGERLAALRCDAGVSQAAIAQRLGCSVSKIQKIEAGDVGVVSTELDAMLDLYGVADPTARDRLAELRRLGKERGWWARFGQLPAPLSTYLGLESAATAIRIFEPLTVPALLQTEAYARAVATATGGAPPVPDLVDRDLEIIGERQRRVLDGAAPRLTVILDEAVLRRPVGGPKVLAAQLDHLIALADRADVRVVPFAHGGYPGLRGAFTLFEFDAGMHSPVGHVLGQAGGQYVEKADQLHRCAAAFARTAEAALERAGSLDLIRAAAQAHQGA